MPKNEERAALRKEKLAELKAEREARQQADPDWFVDAQEAAKTGDLGAAEITDKKKKDIVKRAAGASESESSASKSNIDTSSEQFASDSDQAALTFPKQASAFRRGDLIVYENDVVKVQDMSTSKTGKHGSAKINFRAVSIMTGKNAALIASSTATLPAPFTKQSEYTILNLDGNALTLLNAAGAVHEGVKLPTVDEELANTIRQKFEAGEEFTLTVLSVMGHEMITSIKK